MQIRWSGIPISLKIFQFVMMHTVKVFSIVSEAEVYVFLEFPFFLYDPADFSNLTSGSSAFSISSLYIWKFLVHVLLKRSLKDFEHYFASMCALSWVAQDGKESACNAGDLGLIRGSGRSPGEGKGNPLWYSCLENSMDRRAWRATVHGVPKSRTQLSD